MYWYPGSLRCHAMPTLSQGSSLLAALVGLAVGVTSTLMVQHSSGDGLILAGELSEARRTIGILKGQLAHCAAIPAIAASTTAIAATSSAMKSQPQQLWTDTPDHRRLKAKLDGVVNARGEAMLAIANDVMMCTNRKTCWWNGGNVLETFLDSVARLKVRNALIITLDDATEAFCVKHGGAASIRMELPVPTAQQGSRGANMISTLKYGLLRQALLMGFSILVVVRRQGAFESSPWLIGASSRRRVPSQPSAHSHARRHGDDTRAAARFSARPFSGFRPRLATRPV